MCHYVTLVVPTQDRDAVDAVMRNHNRVATPIDNPSIARLLEEGEYQFLTANGTCDCGTVLARVPWTAEDCGEKRHGCGARNGRKPRSRE